LPHEIEAPRIYHEDGSYDVVKEIGNGEAAMEHKNPDDTPYVDDWRYQQVGDQIIIYENDVEVSRHPKWHLPILLESRRLAYREKYNGK
jgi:hypothetical protein